MVVTFYGPSGDLKPDGALLFEATKLLLGTGIPETEAVRALGLMTKIEILPPDPSSTPGSIAFKYNGQVLVALRLASGQVVVLPPLYAPAGAVIFPSALKHYDANGVLLREIVMNSQGQIVSVTIYGNVPATQIPVKVGVVNNGNLYSEIYYDSQGNVIRIVRYLTPITWTVSEPDTNPALRAQLVGSSSAFTSSDVVYHVLTYKTVAGDQKLIGESYTITTADSVLTRMETIDPVTMKISWVEKVINMDAALRADLMNGSTAFIADDEVFHVLMQLRC
jgi:hypothetical protein